MRALLILISLSYIGIFLIYVASCPGIEKHKHNTTARSFTPFRIVLVLRENGGRKLHIKVIAKGNFLVRSPVL